MIIFRNSDKNSYIRVGLNLWAGNGKFGRLQQTTSIVSITTFFKQTFKSTDVDRLQF